MERFHGTIYCFQIFPLLFFSLYYDIVISHIDPKIKDKMLVVKQNFIKIIFNGYYKTDFILDIDIN